MKKKNNKQISQLERKIKLTQTLSNLNDMLTRADEKQEQLIQKAIIAKQKGLKTQEKLAKLGIANVLTYKKRIEEMSLQLEIVANMRDVTEISKDFLESMNGACRDILEFSKMNNFKKTTKNLNKAYSKVNSQTAQFDMLMEQNIDSFETVNFDISNDMEEEIDNLINVESNSTNKNNTNNEFDDIDERLEKLKNSN